MWNTSNSKVILKWDQVHALENESEVTGYKVKARLSLLSFPLIVTWQRVSLLHSLVVGLLSSTRVVLCHQVLPFVLPFTLILVGSSFCFYSYGRTHVCVCSVAP